jgi:DNA-binding NarL/FixJ family response regulator
LTLQNNLEVPTIVEASDGVEAVELARALRPHLILLDIGIPKLNGIDAARRILEFSPQSKILFVSQESSVDVVQGAFSASASGYVVKMDAAHELISAVRAVLHGERFVGRRFDGHSFSGPSDGAQSRKRPRRWDFRTAATARRRDRYPPPGWVLF